MLPLGDLVLVPAELGNEVEEQVWAGWEDELSTKDQESLIRDRYRNPKGFRMQRLGFIWKEGIDGLDCNVVRSSRRIKTKRHLLALAVRRSLVP